LFGLMIARAQAFCSPDEDIAIDQLGNNRRDCHLNIPLLPKAVPELRLPNRVGRALELPPFDREGAEPA
jgi:hypothetical protein